MAKQHIQKVTIKDVARMCNVSTQTISRVINKRSDVSSGTRQLVEKAVAEMGYRPSALARSLVQKRSYTLGVILAGLKYVGISQTLNGITEQCEASQYALFIKELPRFDTPDMVPVIEALMERHVEGIIFAAPEINENVKLVQSQLPPFCPPIVFLKSSPNPNYTSITVDNYGGARKAVEHLLASGRQNIGLVSGPPESLEARQRKQGWQDALTNAGLPASPEKQATGNWSPASGESAFAELIQKYPAMNAAFISNDQMALGALHYCHANRIRVPEDIAIVGFDNLAESAYFHPSLTTVVNPLRELGILAVETLLTQINAEAQPGRIISLPTELLVRASAP